MPIDRNPDDVFNSIKASDYLNYGSYSGADIKVVVHVPRSRLVSKDLQRQVSDAKNRREILQDEITKLETKLQSNTLSQEKYDNTYLKVIELKKQLDVTAEEEDIAEESQQVIESIPTTITLGELQTISWSTFRDKAPVRTLGSVYPRSYTRGPRTIGGSMVFTVFHKHALHEILEANFKHYSTGTSDYDKQQYTSMLPDQLPPLDVSLVFANEYGAISHMGLYGIEFVQEGGTFSIEDIFSENVVQYVARDMDPMKVVQTVKYTPRGITGEWTKTASQLMADKEDEYGHLRRRNPFI